MPKIFITGIAIFLLLGAGYGMIQAARSIPWNCDDWQALAHEERATAILETLAENRGKTLYCGIDQSDTFAKAETWAAGRDRNERDDTVYQGERGRFRGFTAAQEGWLTEGESGITGQSIASIFEFPREEKKRRKKKERKPNLVYGREYPDSTLSVPEVTAANNPGRPTTGYLSFGSVPGGGNGWLRSPRNIRNGFVRALGPAGTAANVEATARTNAQTAFDANPPTDEQAAGWALNGSGFTSFASTEVPGGATEECQALGYNRATRVEWWYRDANGDGTLDQGTHENSGSAPFQYTRFYYIQYTARCVH